MSNDKLEIWNSLLTLPRLSKLIEMTAELGLTPAVNRNPRDFDIKPWFFEDNIKVTSKSRDRLESLKLHRIRLNAEPRDQSYPTSSSVPLQSMDTFCELLICLKNINVSHQYVIWETRKT